MALYVLQRGRSEYGEEYGLTPLGVLTNPRATCIVDKLFYLVHSEQPGHKTPRSSIGYGFHETPQVYTAGSGIHTSGQNDWLPYLFNFTLCIHRTDTVFNENRLDTEAEFSNLLRDSRRKTPYSMPSARAMEISGAPDPGYIPPSDAAHDNSWYNQDFDGYRISEHPLFARRRLRVVCVGAGATGLQLAYKAERALEEVDLQIYEKNADVGGTWLENRYPGCACDIPSHAYHFTWARNPGWTSYYSGSEEIWRYFKDVAVRYDLEKYVRLNTAVRSARWDDGGGKWHLELSGADGALFTDSCDILISASGILNSWKYPDIPGLDVFGGKLMHSAQWDESFVFDDNVRVAVIGGGSSAVQIVPSLQPKVQKLIAFLRSPVWVTTGFGAKHAAPGGTNFDYSEEQKAAFREDAGLHNKVGQQRGREKNKSSGTGLT